MAYNWVIMDTKILDIFRKHPGEFISGEDISGVLKCTRAAIWKHIDKLRDIGYDIEAVPHLGYRLKGIPDKMLADEIKSGLKTTILGREIYSYANTESTNTIAYDLAEKGAKEGVVVIAEKQDKGKGRLGRKWVSPPGGIYMSCVFRPDIMPAEIQEFTLVAALGVIDAVREVSTNIPVRIKWPNDILVRDKKLCGILTELKAESDRIDFVVLGVGVNANTSEKSLPLNATSIKKEANRTISRLDLVKGLLKNLEKRYLKFKESGFSVFAGEIKANSVTIGKRVLVKSHNASFEGEASDIDQEGALIVRLDDGNARRVLSGDVTNLSDASGGNK